MSSLGGDDGRTILDEEGRLFGLVNIVDLLVVLLVIAVVVAGAALLLSDSGEADTRNVTMNLGPQPDFIAEEVSAGDTFEPQGTNDSVTITDVYRYESEEGTTVIVRATVRGTTIEPSDPDGEPTFQFQGNELRVGQTLPLETSNYTVEGQLTQVQRSGESLPVQQSEFTMQATVPADIADEVAVGDQYRVAGESIAEITALQQFPSTNEGERTLLLGLSAETLDRDGLEFSGQPLRLGSTVPFQADGYELSGAVQRRGTSTIATEERQFVLETTVSANVADDIAVGDTYRLNGQDLVRIESKVLFPSDNPNQRQAVLGVAAVSREEDGTILFGDRELRVGGSLPLQTADYDITGQVTQRGTSDLNVQRRQFVIETDVPATIANEISAGDTYRLGGVDLVQIESASFYTTDNPDQRRAILGVSAITREEDGTILFDGRELRVGASLPVQTSEYDVAGEIIRRDALEQAGDPETVSATLELRNVRPTLADAIEPGDTEQVGNIQTVEITSKATQPADVVLESDDGDIFLREHPRNLDVELGADLEVRRLADGSIQFRGEPLRTDDRIPIELGQLRITVEVTALDQ